MVTGFYNTSITLSLKYKAVVPAVQGRCTNSTTALNRQYNGLVPTSRQRCRPEIAFI